MIQRYYAHSIPGRQPEAGWEPLREHLEQVATLAAQFAEPFGSAEWGRLAGLWHDLGKYRAAFQARLEGERIQVEHAGAGAALAHRRGAMPLALVIAGHHAGLANPIDHIAYGPAPFRDRLSHGQSALDEIGPVIPDALLAPPGLPVLPSFLRRTTGTPDRLRIEMWTRFLFSALVDADFLATEAFYCGRPRGPASAPCGLTVLESRLNAFLTRFARDSDLNTVRAEVLDACRTAASSPPGIFSLTVPTGGGKTLASLAFALRHALVHGKRRVVTVAPFTSVIEQTAAAYHRAVGVPGAVIEHHSAFDEVHARDINPELELQRRLAAENWDAPIIVTTAVQFFESLFANSSSKCRKLHNVAQSVVVIDEAQTLPPEYLDCVLDGLTTLVEEYGCTILLSTATQPALTRRDALPRGLGGVREIIADPRALAGRLRRVNVEWPVDQSPVANRTVADLASRHNQALVIVHRRDDAREVAECLPRDGRFHLSALMCAAHRSFVLGEVRAALAAGAPCRLVATQLVEAGVDIDFPVVYRAFAGIDSLTQAAGRCNREGRLDALGRFVVFYPDSSPPAGAPQRGASIAASMLAEQGGTLDIFAPATVETFFRRFYYASERDRKYIMRERDALNFATVASLVRLVDDGGTLPIIAPWGHGPERLRQFLAAPSRDTQRALQPFLVQVHQRHVGALIQTGLLMPVQDTALYSVTPGYERDAYDPWLGLRVDSPSLPVDRYVI